MPIPLETQLILAAIPTLAVSLPILYELIHQLALRALESWKEPK